MKLEAACLSALVWLSASTGAAAGPIADAGQRAEALAAEGKTLEALRVLDEAVNAIWVESPLQFRTVTLVDAAAGNGTVERSDRVFRPDERLQVRVAPVGYGYGAAGGRTTIGFTGDVSVENATGQVLAEAKDLFSVSVDSAPGNRHFDMAISFAVPYVRPGEYIARFTVRDQNSPKTGTFDVPFTVAPPAADAAPAETTGTAEPQAPAAAGTTATPAPAQ